MVVLGLGSNLGDREETLRRAIRLIAGEEGLTLLTGISTSSVYESDALIPAGAPKDWNLPFLNMAIGGETQLAPETLLGKLKEIEIYLGRKQRARWAPREIDIDILAWGNQVYSSKKLKIPHPGLMDRAFALLPLAEVSPDWSHPCPISDQFIGKKAKDLVIRWKAEHASSRRDFKYHS